MAQPHDDSGLFTLGEVLISFVPGFGIARALRGPQNFLQQTRLLFSVFATAIVILGAVVAVLAASGTDADTSATGVGAGVAAIGVGSLFMPGIIAVPLNCGSPSALLGSYRSRFFIRLAYAEVPALMGFIGFFMTGQWWVYVVGFLFSVLGFIRLAPTDQNVRHDQEALNEAGCGLSLHGLMLSSNN